MHEMNRQPDPRAYGQPDPYEGHYRQQPGGYMPPPAAPPRRKRRVFLWVFAAVQALFLIWLITGLVGTGHTAPSTAELLNECKQFADLYSSHAQCMRTQSQLDSDASGAGRGIGAALIVVLWIVVDFFLGLGYGIYRLASRPPRGTRARP
jgi:hypothetical protein